MKKRLVAIVMGCMLALTAVGCGADKNAQTAVESTESNAAESAETETTSDSNTEAETEENAEDSTDETADADDTSTSDVTTDRSGNAITLPENVENIISMSPCHLQPQEF